MGRTTRKSLKQRTMTYYNTTHEQTPQLDLFTRKAENQDDAVRMALQELGKASASEVLQWLEAKTRLTWVLTSIRRSLSTIAVKTDEKVMGIYGRKEYRYTL